MSRPTYERLNSPIPAFTIFNGSQQVSSQDVAVDTRIYSGVLTPNFRSYGGKGRKRKLPVNDYRVDYTRSTGGVATHTSTGYWGTYHTVYTDSRLLDNFRPHTALASTIVEECSDIAARKLSATTKSAKSNLALAFAERNQTVSLIYDTARRIAFAARAVRKGNLHDAYLAFGVSAKPSKSMSRKLHETPVDKRLSNHWLELQFGWKPLIQDVHDSAELLASIFAGERFRTEARRSHSIRRTFGPYKMDDNGRYWSGEETCKVTYSVRYCLEGTGAHLLSKTGISNPALLAWELLPYSFVVDWFLPVGNYLRTLDAFDGLEILEGYKSYKRETSLIKEWRFNGQQGIAHLTTTGFGTARDFTYARSRTTSWPTFLPPKLRFPIDGDALWKFTTSYALLAQVFRGK